MKLPLASHTPHTIHAIIPSMTARWHYNNRRLHICINCISGHVFPFTLVWRASSNVKKKKNKHCSIYWIDYVGVKIMLFIMLWKAECEFLSESINVLKHLHYTLISPLNAYVKIIKFPKMSYEWRQKLFFFHIHRKYQQFNSQLGKSLQHHGSVVLCERTNWHVTNPYSCNGFCSRHACKWMWLEIVHYAGYYTTCSSTSAIGPYMSVSHSESCNDSIPQMGPHPWSVSTGLLTILPWMEPHLCRIQPFSHIKWVFLNLFIYLWMALYFQLL